MSNKWLFFPSTASASVKLNVDFTLVSGSSSSMFDGTSPTWSGTDAGSPDNYAFYSSYTFQQRNGRVAFRMAFGASGNYANRGDWIAANGNAINSSNTVLTNADGLTIFPNLNTSIFGDSTSTLGFLSFNFQDPNGTWFSSLVAGDTCNIKLDW